MAGRTRLAPTFRLRIHFQHQSQCGFDGLFPDSGAVAGEVVLPEGTVFIGYADENTAFAREYHFCGNREEIREQTIEAALALVLEMNP